MTPAATLTGPQKVAIVLMQMSPENAAKVMGHFSDTEAESIAGEIVRLSRVDAALSEEVIAEFHDLAVSGRRMTRGGRDFAVGLLESSFGANRAAGSWTGSPPPWPASPTSSSKARTPRTC